MGQQQVGHSVFRAWSLPRRWRGDGLQVWLRPEGGGQRFALVGVDQFAQAEFPRRVQTVADIGLTGLTVALPSFLTLHDNVIHSTGKGESAMAANQLVQARIDGAVKEEAAAVLATMGLTVSDAVRLLLTRVAQEKALPFAPLIPNAVTIEAMKEAARAASRSSTACKPL